MRTVLTDTFIVMLVFAGLDFFAPTMPFPAKIFAGMSICLVLGFFGGFLDRSWRPFTYLCVTRLSRFLERFE